MKRTVLAIGALLLSVIICFAGFMILKSTCNKVTDALDKVSQSAAEENLEEAKKRTQEAVQLWENIHGRIEALTKHAETDELEETIKSLTVYAEQGNMERLYEKSEIAKNRLEHIIKNELPSFSNIF